MEYLNKIIKLAEENNGIVTSTMATESGIPRLYLKQLTEKNLLFKISRGVYVLPEAWEDELFVLQYTYRKGIYSHGTALWLLGFSDRTPQKYTMTFPYGYHTESLKGIVQVKKSVKRLYEPGIIEAASPGGQKIKIYSIERTLCDIVRGNNDTDVYLVKQAMKKYALLKEKNIPLLMDYAGKFRVLEKIRSYMEVLL